MRTLLNPEPAGHHPREGRANNAMTLGRCKRTDPGKKSCMMLLPLLAWVIGYDDGQPAQARERLASQANPNPSGCEAPDGDPAAFPCPVLRHDDEMCVKQGEARVMHQRSPACAGGDEHEHLHGRHAIAVDA